MYKTMTLKDLKNYLNTLDESKDDMFIVLPSDDEGNEYRTISNMLTKVRIEEPGDYLEVDFETSNPNALVIG